MLFFATNALTGGPKVVGPLRATVMVSLRTLSVCLSGFIVISVSTAAYAQQNTGGAKATGVQTITVTGFGDPVDKSYRKMISGMDLFERNRAMAPAASLRFKLLPRRNDTNMKRIDLEIVGETFAITVPLAQDNTFTLDRMRKAWD